MTKVLARERAFVTPGPLRNITEAGGGVRVRHRLRIGIGPVKTDSAVEPLFCLERAAMIKRTPDTIDDQKRSKFRKSSPGRERFARRKHAALKSVQIGR